MDEISTSIGVVVAGEITATVTSFMFPSRSKYKTNDGVLVREDAWQHQELRCDLGALRR